MSNREPGWFPDPAGTNQQRYWDGASWSDYYLPYPTGGTHTDTPDNSAYSYLQGLQPTSVDSPAPTYYAPSAEEPVAYPDAQAATGAYPVLSGPPSADTGTATPTYQAGSYHMPQYSSQSPHPGYGPTKTTIGDDPQRPYESTNPRISKAAKYAGIAVIVVLVMALAWGIILTTRDEPDAPGGSTSTTPAAVAATYDYTPDSGKLELDFSGDEIVEVQVEITEPGFYIVEVTDRSYGSDLRADITTTDGDTIIADDRGTTRYGQFQNPADPVYALWWEPGVYPVEVSELHQDEASASFRVAGPAAELAFDFPTQVTIVAGQTYATWVDVPQAGSYTLQATDLNGQLTHIGTINRFDAVEPGSQDPNLPYTTSLTVDLEEGRHAVLVWSERDLLTEAEITAIKSP